MVPICKCTPIYYNIILYTDIFMQDTRLEIVKVKCPLKSAMLKKLNVYL